ALLALGTDEAPTELALQLDYVIRHLLVDEFQDTSPFQTRLLARLTAGWQEGDGRTLFVVGDPMQSIYRFRKADVGMFLSVAESGIGGVRLERLRLYRNNRSCSAVIDWINRAFDELFPPQDEAASGAIRYRPCCSSRSDLDALAGQEALGVQVHALVDGARGADGEDGKDREGGQEGQDWGQHEAALVLALIRAEQQAHPEQRVAVLVRARSHLQALVALIRREQPEMRFQAVELETLVQRQSVQDVLSLTRALLHRGDRLHWLAVLRAPWCGLNLQDLHALAGTHGQGGQAGQAGQQASVWSLMNDEACLARLSLDGQRRLGHVREVLAEVLAQQGRVRLSRWLEAAWLRLGGAACLVQPGEEADVRACFDLFERLDAAGRFSLDILAEEVEGLFAAVDPCADERLQFMTIHKSKGLEFETVILPGLHRGSREDEPPLMLWEEVQMPVAGRAPVVRLAAAPYRPGGAAERSLPTSYDYLRRIEKRRADHEDMRVLYVAATRAIRRLHLVGVGRQGAKEVQAAAGSFLRALWPVAGVAEAFRQAAEPARPTAGMEGAGGAGDEGEDGMRMAAEESISGAAFCPQLVRLRQVGVPALLPGVAKTQEVAAVHELVRQPGEGQKAGAGAGADILAVEVGTLLHRYLELLAGTSLAQWDEARLAGLLPHMQQWFAQRGHALEVQQRGAQRVAQALRLTLASDVGRWLLSAHDEAAAELAITVPREVVPAPASSILPAALPSGSVSSRYAMNIVDRCFVADGVRWIVDYKTALLAADTLPTDEAGWQAHARRYRDQLERYARLFADEGRPLQMAIFYVSHDRLVCLPEMEMATEAGDALRNADAGCDAAGDGAGR
ncbi:MAG: UvrD-helicase domain-containing protein, partial [Sterolibacterium sp.]|nr:UvrD-helicase domain-containing protein [Sterolibacterium sp.]